MSNKGSSATSPSTDNKGSSATSPSTDMRSFLQRKMPQRRNNPKFWARPYIFWLLLKFFSPFANFEYRSKKKLKFPRNGFYGFLCVCVCVSTFFLFRALENKA